MDKVIKFLSDIPGASRRIVSQTREKLYVAEHELPPGLTMHSGEAQKMIYEKGTSEFHSFPQTVDSKCFVYYFCLMADGKNWIPVLLP